MRSGSGRGAKSWRIGGLADWRAGGLAAVVAVQAKFWMLTRTPPAAARGRHIALRTDVGLRAAWGGLGGIFFFGVSS